MREKPSSGLEASNTPSVRQVVAAFALAVVLTYGFAAFGFASSEWVRGDIAPWIEGVLTATFLLGFSLTAMSWVFAGWLEMRRRSGAK